MLKNKRFKFLLVGVVILMIAVSVVSFPKITDKVFAAPQSVHSLKVFILEQDALESALNNWFATQENIVVDGLNVTDYSGSGYLVVISYHTGGTGNSSTRFKLVGGENSEADARVFLSGLSPFQTVRSISATTGYYSGPSTTVTVPLIFIVYE